METVTAETRAMGYARELLEERCCWGWVDSWNRMLAGSHEHWALKAMVEMAAQMAARIVHHMYRASARGNSLAIALRGWRAQTKETANGCGNETQ